MDYEWDPDKDEANVLKHDMSFATARTVFRDPFQQTVEVTKTEHGERRFKRVGRLDSGTMVAVIYTNRDDLRRLISARRARRNERAAYDSSKRTA